MVINITPAHVAILTSCVHPGLFDTYKGVKKGCANLFQHMSEKAFCKRILGLMRFIDDLLVSSYGQG